MWSSIQYSRWISSKTVRAAAVNERCSPNLFVVMMKISEFKPPYLLYVSSIWPAMLHCPITGRTYFLCSRTWLLRIWNCSIDDIRLCKLLLTLYHGCQHGERTAINNLACVIGNDSAQVNSKSSQWLVYIWPPHPFISSAVKREMGINVYYERSEVLNSATPLVSWCRGSTRYLSSAADDAAITPVVRQ